jgi:hypothetical protein
MRVRARKERNAGGGKERAGDPKERTNERRQEPPGGSSRAAAAKLAGAGAVAVAVAPSGVACGIEGHRARGVKEPNNARRQRVCAYAWRRKVGVPSILRGKLYSRRGEQREQGLGRGQGL